MTRQTTTAEVHYDIIFREIEPAKFESEVDLELMEESEAVRQLREMVSETTEPPPFLYTTC